MLGDEKLVSERLAQERDNAEKNARQNETKVFSNFMCARLAEEWIIFDYLYLRVQLWFAFLLYRPRSAIFEPTTQTTFNVLDEKSFAHCLLHLVIENSQRNFLRSLLELVQFLGWIF